MLRSSSLPLLALAAALPVLAPSPAKALDLVCNTLALVGGVDGCDVLAGVDLDIENLTSANILDGSILASDLGLGAVTSLSILDGSILNADLGIGAVTSISILDGSITSVDLDIGAVTTVNIANGAVTTEKIADGAVTTEKIANNAVTSEKIADGAIESRHLSSELEARFGGMENDIAGLKRDVKTAHAGVAMAFAMANAPTVPADRNFGLSVGVGAFQDKFATAIKGSARLTEDTAIQASLATDFDTVGGGVGIGFWF